MMRFGCGRTGGSERSLARRRGVGLVGLICRMASKGIDGFYASNYSALCEPPARRRFVFFNGTNGTDGTYWV